MQPSSIIPPHSPICAQITSLSQLALFTTQYHDTQNKPLLVVVDDNHAAYQLREIMRLFAPSKQHQIHVFPDWETLPYENTPIHQRIISKRLRTLHALQQSTHSIVITSIMGLLIRTVPQSFIQEQCFSIRIGEIHDRQILQEQLTERGYIRTPIVRSPGEYVFKGSILDIFPPYAQNPLRIDFFDEQVDSIHTFSADSQMTLENTNHFEIIPTHEYDLNQPQKIWQSRLTQIIPNATTPTINLTTQSKLPLQHHLPLFHNALSNILKIIHNETHIILPEHINEHIQQQWQTINTFQRKAIPLSHLPILPPESIYLTQEDVETQLKQHRTIPIITKDEPPRPFHSPSIDFNSTQPIASIQALQKQNMHLCIITEHQDRATKLSDYLRTHHLNTSLQPSIASITPDPQIISITIGHLDRSIFDAAQNILLTPEDELIAHIHTPKPNTTTQTIEQQQTIDVSSMNPGDAVIHNDHGIGIYQGIKNIQHNNIPADYLELVYANGDLIYLPMHQLSKIRYHRSKEQCDSLQLDRLGTSHWHKKLHKAKEQAHELSAQLLTIYAKRQTITGQIMQCSDHDYQRFDAAFPFELTDDQLNAIRDIHTDMAKPIPMDRLVCGDVGFGKTEVAMRASLTALCSNKQVIVVAPTTLLAQQHFRTFTDRFAAWPYHIELMHGSKKTTTTFIESLGNGSIDLLVTTHKLFYNTPKFRDLGLIIIDEEHRFGVKHKEKLKSHYPNIDLLCMSATPIPRSLNMAMHALRDISIMAKPPIKRKSIITQVCALSQDMLLEAITREIARGGQIYALHHEIRAIEATQQRLQQQFPQLTMRIAHGNMSDVALESIMHDFHRNQFQLLLCTTIIESGIDVANANTMLVFQADRFGLSQLHQLRGRVGRSSNQAYTYLFVPEHISQDALKRLEALQTHQQLGSGFALASLDLEIRGAGELLGDRQSGHAERIGMSLFCDMIQEATQALQQGKLPDLDDIITPLDIKISPALNCTIPDIYMEDTFSRLAFYRRFSLCKDPETLDQIRTDLITQFGLPPTNVEHLFDLAHLKMAMMQLQVKSSHIEPQQLIVQFSATAQHIDVQALMLLLREAPHRFALPKANALTIYLTDPKKTPLQQARQHLKTFAERCIHH